MDPSLRLVLANNFKELRNIKPIVPKVFVPPRIDLRLDTSKPLQRSFQTTEQFLPGVYNQPPPTFTTAPVTPTQQESTMNILPMSPQEEKQNSQELSYMPGWQSNQTFQRNTTTNFDGLTLPTPSPWTFYTRKPPVMTLRQPESNMALTSMPSFGGSSGTNVPLPPFGGSSGMNVPLPPVSLPQQFTMPTLESGAKAGFESLPPATNFKDKTTKSAYYSTDVKKHYINIDTRYRSNASITTTTNFRWRFFQPMKNIISLRIASVEIPNNAYTFSAVKQNISFQIKLSASPSYTTITIPEGNYTVVELEDAINDAIQVVDGGFLFDINTVTGKSTFTHSTQQFNIIFPQINTDAVSDWGIGYNLGFTQPSYANKTSLTSERVVHIIGDIYYFLKIGDFEGVEHNREGQTRLAATAKIIANADKYSIIYDNGSNFMTKQVDFSNPQNIASFDVVLVDSNNMSVDLLGGNWSCTLELVEVLNSELYTGFSDHLLKNTDTPR